MYDFAVDDIEVWSCGLAAVDSDMGKTKVADTHTAATLALSYLEHDSAISPHYADYGYDDDIFHEGDGYGSD